nr:hypothetical protein [Saccharicrinis fermentans]
MGYLVMGKVWVCSLAIKIKNTMNVMYKDTFIHAFELDFAEKYTAVKEIIRNIRSIALHQAGASAQQLAAQAWAIKINGVRIQ